MRLVFKRLYRTLVDFFSDFAYFKNRLKRISDIFANLGVASLAVGLFRSGDTAGDAGIGETALLWGVWCLVISIILTMEDR